MKRTTTLLFVAASTLFLLLTGCQQNKTGQSNALSAEEIAAVGQTIGSCREAYKAKDLDRHMSHYATDAVFIVLSITPLCERSQSIGAGFRAVRVRVRYPPPSWVSSPRMRQDTGNPKFRRPQKRALSGPFLEVAHAHGGPPAELRCTSVVLPRKVRRESITLLRTDIRARKNGRAREAMQRSVKNCSGTPGGGV